MAVDDKTRTSDEVTLDDFNDPVLPTVNPAVERVEPAKASFHPAVYIATWITLSSSVIIFNKWILATAHFRFPIFLTTWHLVFATLMTQIMARFTHVLDSRHSVPMTGRVYLRAILPIAVMFSLSLICGNLTYLYLSVSFIQMLKATMPVAVMLASWALGVSSPNLRAFGNVSFIVVGVIIASFGEIKFVLIGFLFQAASIVFEAVRLTLVERLLNGAEFKMNPLVSLYYFAPACAIINAVIALVVEIPRMSMQDIYNVGVFVLLANAMVAFALNVSGVFLIGKTSSLVLTLSGVLKDILLVFASTLIFRDPVTRLQIFGYGIALAGLVYYKLGAENLKAAFARGRTSYADYRAAHPAMAKVIVFGVVVVVLMVLVGGVFPFVPEQYTGGVGRWGMGGSEDADVGAK